MRMIWPDGTLKYDSVSDNGEKIYFSNLPI